MRELRVKLNAETAQLRWAELARFFAAGSVVWVDDGLDLIDVAVALADDDAAAFRRWLEDGRVARVSDAQALQWHETDAALWTVVVKPWVLVQSVRAPGRRERPG